MAARAFLHKKSAPTPTGGITRAEVTAGADKAFTKVTAARRKKAHARKAPAPAKV